MKSLFKGSGTALATPFHETGVNLSEFERLLDFQLSNGTDALIVCGTTGEPSTMTDNEKKLIIEFTIEYVKGRVPVIIGAGGNDTAACIKNAKRYRDMGADALLIVTPYYNKATQDGLVAHYNAIDEAVELPYIVYNVPGRTGLNILPSTVKKLMDSPRLAGVKEASGNISQVVELAALCPGLPIYSGNDDQVLPILSVGGAGVISVIANIAPRQTHDMVSQYFAGDLAAAIQLQLDMKPLADALFYEVNPIPVKAALNLMGFDFGEPRLPLTPYSAKYMKILEEEMRKFGIEVK